MALRLLRPDVDHLDFEKPGGLQQDTFDDSSCLELFRFHYTWWSWAVWGGSIASVSDLCWSPASVLLTPHLVVLQPNVSWIPPSHSSGISGVLRDHRGSLLFHFTKHVDVTLAIQAEVLAIRECFLMQHFPNGPIQFTCSSNLIRRTQFHGLATPRLLHGGFWILFARLCSVLIGILPSLSVISDARVMRLVICLLVLVLHVIIF